MARHKGVSDTTRIRIELVEVELSGLVGGGFGGGMQAMLGHFVGATRQGLNSHPEEVIHGQPTLANRVGFLDGFNHIGFR